MGLARVIEESPVFAGIGLYASGGLNLGGEPAARVRAAAVSPGFFRALGAAAVAGRWFTADDVARNPHVAVVGFTLWRQRFAADPALPGRTILLNGRPYEVTGVLPDRVDFPDQSEVWIPSGTDSQITGVAFAPDTIARLAPGVSRQHAATEVNRINEARAGGDPERRGPDATATPLHERLVSTVRPTVLLVWGAVTLVLLVACANAANLLLARMASRDREFAVRRAVGASTVALARQVTAESAALALLGALAAMPAAWLTIAAVRLALPATMHGMADIRLDGRTLAATVVFATIAAIAAGCAPLLSIRGDAARDALRGRAGGTASPLWSRCRSTLVVAQVAMALVLLAGAGAVVQTVWRLMAVDLGARGDRALVVQFTLPRAVYDTHERTSQFQTALLERIEALPGVERAGMTSFIPGSREVGIGRRIALDGSPWPAPGAEQSVIELRASPGYFQALGIDLLAGRSFEAGDIPNTPPVAIVNEHIVRRAGLAPAEAIGRRLDIITQRQQQPHTIVGVVRDVRLRGPESGVSGQIYRPFTQAATFGTTYLTVRAVGDPRTMGGAIRAAAGDIDRGLPLYSIRTFDEIRGEYLADRRFAMLMMAAFGGLAVMLAGIGLYGVISYLVQLRTREIGIRMALGASAAGVRWGVMRSGLVHAAAGSLLGSLGAAAVSRLLCAAVPGLDVVDPLSVAALALVMLLIAGAATWLPARRATQVDPLVALRVD